MAYFTDGKAVQGSEAYSYKWLGATWWFASDAHRSRFAASPISYAPQYGGACAEGVAVAAGVSVNTDPESWRIIDGKLYLSSDARFQDRTLDVAAAERNWPIARANFEKQTKIKRMKDFAEFCGEIATFRSGPAGRTIPGLDLIRGRS